MEPNNFCKLLIAGQLLVKAKEMGIEIVLPRDHVIRNKETGEIKKDQTGIHEGWYGTDIGSETLKDFIKIIDEAGFVIMSGPVGIFDDSNISEGSKGSEEIIREMEKVSREKGVVTVSAGGETTFLVNKMKANLSHVSIGGGSTLEFIEKGTLVGIEALKNSAKSFQ